MLIRQNGPVFGSSNPYSQPGETQVNLSFRGLHSEDHYNGDIEQVQRHTLGTYVVNKQRAVDLTFTHTFTPRFSASVGVPYVNASWGIPTPINPPGTRANENGRGLGDISVSGRMWILPTDKYTSGNISIGLGLKTPSGNSRYKDTFPASNGTNNIPRPVDMSVQPGDGGWGIMMEASAFRKIPHAQVFGQVSYLANPRDTNGTPSIAVSRLAPGQTPGGNPDRWVNSVPDQYLVRAGGAFPIVKGFAGSIAWRAEGQKRYDLFGASHGFRRPGIEMFVEPGISYAKGAHMFALQLPIGFYRDRFPDPYTGNKGDATFPKHIFLASYGYRFGGSKAPSAAICQ